MQSGRNKIFCTQCGAQIPPGEAVCPYCGSAYAPEAERAYMRRLHQIRNDLDKVGDAGAAESAKETRRLRRRITLVLGIILSLSAILYGAFFFLRQKEEQENRREYLWAAENIPAFDAMFEKGDYDGLADAFLRAQEDGHSLYDWEHYDFCTVYAKIQYIDGTLQMRARGAFPETDAALLLYDELCFRGAPYRSRMPEEDLEILQALFAPYSGGLTEIFRLAGEELNAFDRSLQKSGGYPDYDACRAYVRSHPEILIE